MSRKFNRYFDLQKVEANEDGTSVRVSGICSSETRDSDGEVITADAMRKAIPEYMQFGAVREMHSNIAAGVMLEISVDDDGVTHCEADIVDEGSIKKLLHDPPILKGFSVGGKKLKRNAHDRRVVEEIKLTEVSLVDRPNNPDALFELAKFDGGVDEEDDLEGGPVDPNEPLVQTEAPAGEPLRKSIYDVKQFADLLQSIGFLTSGAQSESMWEGDSSPIPAKLKTWLAAGTEIFKAMADEEIAELLASLKVGDTLAQAAHADDLVKGGKKFSAGTKAKLAEAHGHITAANDSLAKAAGCMKDTGFDAADDDTVQKAEGVDDLHKVEGDQVEDREELLQKAAGLTEENTTLRAENDDLRKMAGELQAGVEELLRQQPKGALRAVPVDKAKDNGLAKVEGSDPTPEEAEDLRKRAEDPKEAIKGIFRRGGTPVFSTTSR